MGNYIVQADLDVYSSEDVLVQLTDDDNTGSVDTDMVDECIVAAESEVDSYLAVQYEVPITTTVPEVVKEWAVQLTTLRLHQRRLPVPQDIWEMAKVARDQLRLVANGTIKLNVGVDPPAEASTREAQFELNTRLFSRTTLSDW